MNAAALVDGRDLAAVFGADRVLRRLGPYLGPVGPVRYREFDAAVALGMDLQKLRRALVEQRLRRLAAG
jgi:hypothetical protein